MAAIISSGELARLRQMVEALVRCSTVDVAASISVGRNLTGCRLLLPGCNSRVQSTYPAFWARDPAWLAPGGLATEEDVWGWTSLLCGTMQGPEARELASGATIPPFAIPDHVNLDGSAVYFPGTYDSGENQGGPTWGLLPPHDNQYWLTFTAYAYMELSGDRAAGARLVATDAGDIPLWQACDLAHHASAVDATTGCCVVAEDVRQVDWGYNDAIVKSGQVLLPTLLRLESCLKLAAILEGSGLAARATAVRAQAALLRRSIPEVFAASYTRAEGEETWLVSATGAGNLPDVWGTAYAVHRGMVEGSLAGALARALLRAYEHRTAVRQGQVCHVPRDYGFWKKTHVPEGEYQNGAFWGYPVGWYVSALARVDRKAARALFMDYLAAVAEGWDGAGRDCAYECVNPAIGYRRNPGYLTTIALPYVVLAASRL